MRKRRQQGQKNRGIYHNDNSFKNTSIKCSKDSNKECINFKGGFYNRQHPDEIENLSTGSASLDRFPIYVKGNSSPYSYLASIAQFHPNYYDSWEISFECEYYRRGGGAPHLVSGYNYTGGSYTGGYFALALNDSSNKPYLYFSSADAGSFDIASGFECNLTFTEGTVYYLKFGFSGTAYYLDYNTAGWNGSFTRAGEVSSSTKMTSTYRIMFCNQSNNLGNYNSPSILHNISIKGNGQEIFSRLGVYCNGANNLIAYTEMS